MKFLYNLLLINILQIFIKETITLLMKLDIYNEWRSLYPYSKEGLSTYNV